MRKLVTTLLVGLAAPVAAQDLGLAPLMTGDDARGWEAVGRIDIDGRGFCTGSLIAPDVVLTAAHCMFDRDSGKPITIDAIHFAAGLRNGRALAYRDVTQVVTPADYSFDPRVSNASTRHDLALIRLDQPIRLSQITPFDTAVAVRPGDDVDVVSYAHDRAEAPSLEEGCGVLGSEDGIIVISCDVDYGASGAPIFDVFEGRARIVSVVSAKATLDGEPVALGTSLLGPLEELRGLLAQDGQERITSSDARVLTPGERADTGARFVTP